MFDSEQRTKMSLFELDLNADAQTSDTWAGLCEMAVEEGGAHGVFDRFETKYRVLLRAGDLPALCATLKADMLDNYIIGAFAAGNVKVPLDIPMIAWSAWNKREYAGLRGEIATIRSLIWMGFAPSAQDETGASALHYMVNIKYGTGCNARALQYLLEAGADPNIATDAGDTPLITLCGAVEWSDERSECMKLLVRGGANPFWQSGDGATPLSVLETCESQFPHPDRHWFISALKASQERAVIENALADGVKRPDLNL